MPLTLKNWCCWCRFWQEASAPGFSGWEGRTSRSRVSGSGRVTCRPWAATGTGPPGNPTTLTVTSTAWRWTWGDSTIGTTTTVKTDSTSSVKCRTNNAFFYTQSYCSLHFIQGTALQNKSSILIYSELLFVANFVREIMLYQCIPSNGNSFLQDGWSRYRRWWPGCHWLNNHPPTGQSVLIFLIFNPWYMTLFG